jgi:hypothetical protein
MCRELTKSRGRSRPRAVHFRADLDYRDLRPLPPREDWHVAERRRSKVRDAFATSFRYLTVTEGGSFRQTRAWKVSAAIRWAAAVLVVVLAAIAAGHDVCHVTTTTRTGLGVFSGLPRTETAQVCSAPGFPDLLGYFAIVAVLLLPDAKSIGIGGLQFERLTTEIERQRTDIASLRNTISVSNRVSVQLEQLGSTLNELRSGFRRQKEVLDALRNFLPRDKETIGQLSRIDEVARLVDSPETDLAQVIVQIARVGETMTGLTAEAKLIAAGITGDTPQDAVSADALAGPGRGDP